MASSKNCWIWCCYPFELGGPRWPHSVWLLVYFQCAMPTSFRPATTATVWMHNIIRLVAAARTGPSCLNCFKPERRKLYYRLNPPRMNVNINTWDTKKTHWNESKTDVRNLSEKQTWGNLLVDLIDLSSSRLSVKRSVVFRYKLLSMR